MDFLMRRKIESGNPTTTKNVEVIEQQSELSESLSVYLNQIPSDFSLDSNLSDLVWFDQDETPKARDLRQALNSYQNDLAYLTSDEAKQPIRAKIAFLTKLLSPQKPE